MKKKVCLIFGDFNINLLNNDNHPLTQDFINTLTSFCLKPHILQPTRINSHSSTLIDNTILNSIDYHSFLVSGNFVARFNTP